VLCVGFWSDRRRASLVRILTHSFVHYGIHSFLQIAHATIRKLSDVKGISEAKVLKLKEIVKAMVPMDFKTAADALVDRK
jgi:hypothetical protein